MRLFSLLTAAAVLAIPAWTAQIPRPAPAMNIPLTNGTTVTLEQYKGKVVVLEFMLTTCPACQKASVALNKVYGELGAKGMQPIGIAINPMANMLIPDYLKKFSIDFPIGFNENQDQVKEFLQHPMIQILRVPQLVFIDKKGVIRAQHGGVDDFFNNEEANIRAEVEKLLAEPGPAATKTVSSAKKK